MIYLLDLVSCNVHIIGMVTAKRIADLRKRLGESQVVFGARFPVDQATISRWEGEGPPQTGLASVQIFQMVDAIERSLEVAGEPANETAR